MQATDLNLNGARTGHPEDTTALTKPTHGPPVPAAGSLAPRPLNGYTVTSLFRKLRSRWSFTHLEAHLFLELIALATEESWPVEFSAKNPALTAALGCSEKGLIKARKTLVDAGLLTYTEGQNRRPTRYRFCLGKGLPEVSVLAVEHLPEALPEVSVSTKHLPEHLPKGLPEVSPYKEVIKIKKKVCSKRENETAQPAADFDAFWEAYDMKVGKHKAREKWAVRTPSEQAAALAHVPRYVAATPDKQYRKHAATYLHQRVWEDEELPPLSTHLQPSPLHAPAPPAPVMPAAPTSPDLDQQVVAAREAQRLAELAEVRRRARDKTGSASS